MWLHLPFRFLLVPVCVTQVSVVEGEAEGDYRLLTARYDSAHTYQRLAAISHGSGQFHPQILWATLLTPVRHRLCLNAVNIRVKAQVQPMKAIQYLYVHYISILPYPLHFLG
jgi:hypothetical protein